MPSDANRPVTTAVVRIDLPLVLPRAARKHDECVEALRRVLTAMNGVDDAHIVTDVQDTSRRGVPGEHAVPVHGDALCVHFEPSVVSLEAICEVAADAGVILGDGIGRARLPLCGRATAACLLGAMNATRGVTDAWPTADGVAIVVEYDATITALAELVARWRRCVDGS